MDYKIFDNFITVRLDKGESVLSSLLFVAKKERLTLATIQGIGATDDFEVGVFDLEKSAYDHIHFAGNHEINSLVGNLTTKEGEPYLHLHITATGEGGKVVGGHLFDAKISLTAEIFLITANGKAERKFDETLGINRIEF